MKQVKMSTLGVACFGVLVAAGAAATGFGQSGSSASMMDKHFVSGALEGGMAEVQMGQLAADKGNSADVRKFGERMVKDHDKLGDQMKDVAGEIGVKPPTSPSIMEQLEIKKLKGLSGEKFDQEYIKEMVKDHQDDLKDFQKEANTGTSSTVKEAANHGASVISDHLSIIRGIAQKHDVTVASN